MPRAGGGDGGSGPQRTGGGGFGGWLGGAARAMTGGVGGGYVVLGGTRYGLRISQVLQFLHNATIKFKITIDITNNMKEGFTKLFLDIIREIHYCQVFVFQKIVC